MQEPMQEQQRWDQLEAAVRDAVETSQGDKHSRRKSARVATPPSRTLVLFSLLLWVFIAWIWSTRPAFLFGEPARKVSSPAVDEATLRFALYLERGRVEAYVRRTGQLPANLGATGTVEEGVAFLRTSDGYHLIGRRGASELQLSSRMNADSFLGNSLQVLRQSTGNQQ
jgi:hypothetical protein